MHRRIKSLYLLSFKKKKKAYYLKIPADGLQRQPWKAEDWVRDEEKQPAAAGGGALATTTTSQRPVSDDPHLMGNVSTTVNFRRRSAVSNHHLSLLTPTQIYYWQYFFWPETEASQKMWGKVRASVAQGNIVLWVDTEKINCCNCN